MGQLKENLQAIKAEKDKIDANYISSLSTIFGIRGNVTDNTNDEGMNNLSRDIIDNENNKISTSEVYTMISCNNLMNDVSDLNRRMIIDKNTKLGLGIKNTVLADILTLTPEKLIRGNKILGIEGIAQPYVDPTTTQDYQDCLALTQQILGTEVNS